MDEEMLDPSSLCELNHLLGSIPHIISPTLPPTPTVSSHSRKRKISELRLSNPYSHNEHHDLPIGLTHDGSMFVPFFTQTDYEKYSIAFHAAGVERLVKKIHIQNKELNEVSQHVDKYDGNSDLASKSGNSVVLSPATRASVEIAHVDKPPEESIKIMVPIASKPQTDIPVSLVSKSSDVLPTPLSTPSHQETFPLNQHVSAKHYSTLTKEEHSRYLYLKRVAAVDPSLLHPHDLPALQSLNTRVLKEQQQYLEKLFQTAISHRDTYRFIHPQVKCGVKPYLEFHEHRLLEYPRYYQLLKSFGLGLGQTPAQSPALAFRRMLLQLGKCPQFLLSKVPSRLPLEEELFPCVSSKPSPEVVSNSFKYKVKQILPAVSNDPNLPPMIEAVRAHIAISSGTLCKLVELIGSTETDFHIPIHVKEEIISDENENDEESVLKAVYIDKPIRPRNLTPRIVNQKFFRTAVLKVGTTSSGDEDHGLSLGRVSFTDPDDEVESDDDSRPVDSQTETNISLDSTGIFYSEWTLGSHTLIVRFKVDAYLPVQQSSSDEKPQRPHYFIGVKPKIEIDVPSDDPHLHFETYTPSELSSLWMYSQLRGDGLVVIPHVNPQSGAISTVDVLDPKKLRNLESATLESSMAAHSAFSWSTVCKSQAVLLDSLFTKLKQLEPGHYILHHGRDDTHAVIYRHVPIDLENAESDQTLRLFDLHNLYKSSLPSDPQKEFTTDYRVKQWRPLDSNDLQIPYTFPIAPTHPVPGISDDNSGGVKHCYSFALKGYCKVQNCRYPHLTATEVTVKQQQEWKSRSSSISSTSSSQSTMMNKSKRKGKRNPKAKSKPAPPASIDLDNVGADVDAEYIKSIVAGYD